MSSRTYTTSNRKWTGGVRFDPDTLLREFHARGWYTIPEAAAAIGVSGQTVYQILSGRRTASAPTARKIERALEENQPTGSARLLA